MAAHNSGPHPVGNEGSTTESGKGHFSGNI